MMYWSPSCATKRPVTLTVQSRQALLSEMAACLRQGTGFTIATLNLDHVVKLRSDPAFHAAYNAHSHVTADGRPIVWLSHLAGSPVELVTGSDLLEPTVAVAAELGVPVAFFGATEEVLETAAQRLTDRHPGLQITAKLAPPMGFDPQSTSADEFISELAASGARLCLLALGAPKQELFAARAAAALPQMGFLSIGAGLDFIAGTQIRAPRLLRALAAEWIWRLLSNPRRLAHRYWACLMILPQLTLRATRARYQPPKEVAE